MKGKIKITDFKNHQEFEDNLICKIEEIINESDLEKKYSLIIDYICDFLDAEMMKHNYCDFQDGKCIANRLGKTVRVENGCCYKSKVGLCKHLNNGCCLNKNIACKLFFCRYLEGKGVKYNIRRAFPVKLVFNKKQIGILEKKYFKAKEEIIDVLIKNERRQRIWTLELGI